MRAIANHWFIRLRAVAAEPFALMVLLFTGSCSLFFWPAHGDLAGRSVVFGTGFGSSETSAMILLWIYTWTMMAAMLVPGTSTGGNQGWGYVHRAMPALPIGPRSRIAAEAFVVLSFVILFRLPFILLGEPAHAATGLPLFQDGPVEPARFAWRTIEGGVLMLPCLVAWLLPGASIHTWFLKPLVVLVLMFGMHAAGLFAESWSMAACCLVLAGLCFATADRRIPAPSFKRHPVGPPESRYRPGIDPGIRLRRDRWTKPLPVAAALMGAEILVLAFEHTIGFPRFGFYFCSTLVFSLMLSLVLMRPLGSFLIAAAIRGDSNVRLGDFAAAWSVLPVRPESLIRGVYAHGFIIGAGTWLLILGTNLLHTYLNTGEAYLSGIEGENSAELLLFAVAAVPCLAGALTCGAVGDRGRGFLSLAAAFGILVGHFVCLLLKAGPALHIGVIVILAFVGGVPPLVHLRRRTAPDSRRIE